MFLATVVATCLLTAGSPFPGAKDWTPVGISYWGKASQFPAPISQVLELETVGPVTLTIQREAPRPGEEVKLPKGCKRK